MRTCSDVTSDAGSNTNEQHSDVLGLGRALVVVGDQPSTLIIREAFLHARRFKDFQAVLDLSDAVLSRRLRDLVTDGVFDTVPYSDRPLRVEYRLTEQGRDLWRVFVAIWSWEARWIHTARRPPRLIHDACGQSITPHLGCGVCGATGVNHRQTRAVQRPGTTFEQSNPARRYRRSRLRPATDRAHLHPELFELLGDRWSVAVLGAALLGLSRFGDFESALGISPHLLSDRLGGFVDNQVLAKVPVADGARRQGYRLMPKGLDMMPVFAMTNDWANRWYPDAGGPALQIFHTACDTPLEPVWICNACGDPLTRATVHYDV